MTATKLNPESADAGFRMSTQTMTAHWTAKVSLFLNAYLC